MTCSSCATGIDHCHGTLLEHAAGFVECTDIDCVSVRIERHVLATDCGDIVGGCGCVESIPAGSVRPEAGPDAVDESTSEQFASAQLLRAS
ncbi:hypothetical protein BJF85_20215 [Saccharomonospora sp. CUA-673]|uniref:hypothetical protein n=1 Tax=Saccharomonospora sp. CUA-673 TaxID=1904969 RepID=UPI00096251CB|nr:hypothetical protein [Saccharomonospora sp. CUA-673]OLT44204.1 hypothetical protein BJF85_20215 [Saccharomonospora sp. CUA-673]